MSRIEVYKPRKCHDADPASLGIQKKIRGLILATQMYEDAENWGDYAKALRDLGGLYQKLGDLDKVMEVTEKELGACKHLPGKVGLKVKAK